MIRYRDMEEKRTIILLLLSLRQGNDRYAFAGKKPGEKFSFLDFFFFESVALIRWWKTIVMTSNLLLAFPDGGVCIIAICISRIAIQLSA